VTAAQARPQGRTVSFGGGDSGRVASACARVTPAALSAWRPSPGGVELGWSNSVGCWSRPAAPGSGMASELEDVLPATFLRLDTWSEVVSLAL
jgi:hypothetical protein